MLVMVECSLNIKRRVDIVTVLVEELLECPNH